MSFNRPYKKSSEWLTLTEYIFILNNIKLDECIDKPPVKPNPNEIYVYFNENNPLDWKADQHRWRDKGKKPLPKPNPIITCHYFDTYEGEGFKKRAYTLLSGNPVTLIHYWGSSEKVVHLPHGNRKRNLDVKHVITAASQMMKQKRLLKQQPHEIYKTLSLEEEHPALVPVLLPRDHKQVSNTTMNERERRLLSSDDIVGLYLINSELGGYVEQFQLLPDFFAVIISKDMKEKLEDIDDLDCTFFYDTTFNLGDFYVSVLTYKHPLFENNPVIPLAYLIHHTKKKEIHLRFFTYIRQYCPSIVKNYIVTDREAAIQYAIKQALPTNKHFLCWNHILQDVKNWIRKQANTDIDDIKTYTNHTWDLLDSTSEEMCNAKYKKMATQWSYEFKKYFESYLYKDILKNGKWILIEYDLYTERSGITINAAESFNAVLKRFTKHREVKLQVLVLTLYQLDKFYLKEITKGMCNLGNFKLCNKYKDIYYCDPSEIKFPIEHLPLKDLPYVFENRTLKRKSLGEEPFTNFSIAKMLVLEGKVKLIAEVQAFLISSENTKHVVTLFPKESCSCRSKRNCHHIKAAKISIGYEEHKSKSVKLSDVIRKTRGFKSGRKKIPKNLTLVEAAEDSSILRQGKQDSTSILIPTIGSQKPVVKHRFFMPKTLSEGETFQDWVPRHPILEAEPKEDGNKEKSDAEDTPYHQIVKLSSTTSTPVLTKNVRKRKYLLPEHEHDSELDFTFYHKFKNNKQFIISGCPIYPSDLEVLHNINIAYCKDTDKYVSDTILDIYTAILIHESKHKYNVKVFSVEAFIANNITSPTAFINGLQYFVKHKIPELDIVLIPITYSNHCTLIIILRKQKFILHLDSLNNVSNIPHLPFILKLYQASYTFLFDYQFPSEEWKIFYPKKIPHQNNYYDCGIYCCMYAELLITQEDNVLIFHNENKVIMYRKRIKDKIIEYMKNPIVPAPTESTYNKNTLLHFIEPADIDYANLNIIKGDPTDNTTTQYLVHLINSYWDETSTTCNNSSCQKFSSSKLVLCNACDHWYHLICEGIVETEKLPKYYICIKCRAK